MYSTTSDHEDIVASMPKGSDDATGRRSRSARYPGVALGEAIAFCRQVDDRGHDGQTAAAIASALGHANVRNNSFSTRLSAARQFGLLVLEGDRYHLSALSRSILHPVDLEGVPALLRRALAEPPLYATLLSKLANRVVPDVATLANLLYHDDRITASAKDHAAEAFLASSRFAGALGDDGVLRPEGVRAPIVSKPSAAVCERPAPRPTSRPSVRIDLPLWGDDAGKVVKVRAPGSMTAASLERLIAALRLHIRIDGGQE